MKKLAIVIIALLFIQITALSQSCLSEGITFTTQTEIDNFQINYPGCTEIEGSVIIQGYDITNINGLSVLIAVGGYLNISANDTLTSLTGLDNVTSIGGTLRIIHNDVLTSLTGLENVTSIGGGLFILSNNALISLTGLDNLNAIGGELRIYLNSSLTSLKGLDHIDAGSISDLTISHNSSLSTCEVQSVCDYLASPNGLISIKKNATGCNSQAEVEEACEAVSVESLEALDGLLIYPNPLFTSTTIEYELVEPAKVSLTIYNHLGQKIETLVNQHQQIGKHKVTWNAEGLPAGIYFYKLQAGEQYATGKMVVVK
ncbi:T9SS type A sorting domain-containing protein [bacterium]|nr:T9SS type A sorting domain-containing protein [bacterium]